jgi:predicted O-methyltransferase YrrM
MALALLKMAEKDPELNQHDFRFGLILFELVQLHRPRVIVELGTGRGFTSTVFALATAAAGTEGRVISIDTGTDCPTGGRQSGGYSAEYVQDHLRKYGVAEMVELRNEDYHAWLQHLHDDPVDDGPTEAFDMLYVDVDNDGSRLREIHRAVSPRLQRPGTIMLFEGGSEERDAVEWMIREHKEPIRSILPEIPFRCFYGGRHTLSIVTSPSSPEPIF